MTRFSWTNTTHYCDIEFTFCLLVNKLRSRDIRLQNWTFEPDGIGRYTIEAPFGTGTCLRVTA
jgi:hypothetical protein